MWKRHRWSSRALLGPPALGTGNGAAPAPRNSPYAVFMPELELLEPAFPGAGEVPALPEVAFPATARAWPGRQLGSKFKLRIRAGPLHAPQDSQGLRNTNIPVSGQHSSDQINRCALSQRYRLETSPSVIGKHTHTPPPRSLRNMDSQQNPCDSRCALAMTNVNA